METIVKSLKWNKAISSAVFFLLGLILLIWPIEALSVGSKLIAFVLLIGGIGNIIHFLVNKNIKTNFDVFYLIASLVAIGVSISIFVNPTWIIAAINIIVGIALIVSAVSNISNAFIIKTNDKIWWFFAIIPIITLILGLIIIIKPMGMASFITRMEGISLIIDAVTTCLVMYRLNLIQKM